MKRFYTWALVLGIAFGLLAGGCAGTAPQKDMTAKDLVNEAKQNICEITVAEAKEILDQGGYVFIDCREPKEYKMGHIPGSINVPRGLMEFQIDKKVPDKNQNMVVYCKSGGRGCLTTCTLCRMGYKNVKNVDGGWLAWEKAGYPIE
ncbi:MAG: rhodanese-like domain-containing protein [Desulfobacterales bacterium]|jgi:rhodanese-related sulfurtransferase